MAKPKPPPGMGSRTTTQQRMPPTNTRGPPSGYGSSSGGYGSSSGGYGNSGAYPPQNRSTRTRR